MENGCEVCMRARASIVRRGFRLVAHVEEGVCAPLHRPSVVKVRSGRAVMRNWKWYSATHQSVLAWTPDFLGNRRPTPEELVLHGLRGSWRPRWHGTPGRGAQGSWRKTPLPEEEEEHMDQRGDRTLAKKDGARRPSHAPQTWRRTC